VERVLEAVLRDGVSLDREQEGVGEIASPILLHELSRGGLTMDLSELIGWHRAEGLIAWKKYQHAMTHGLKDAAQFHRAFHAFGDTVEALIELHCRRQSRRPVPKTD
jgi:hypothetical protein